MNYLGQDWTTTDRALTPGDLIELADMLALILANKRVRVLVGDDIRTGTLRYLDGPDGGRRPEDVRECYVRITWDTGMDQWLPLAELAHKRAHGALAEA